MRYEAREQASFIMGASPQLISQRLTYFIGEVNRVEFEGYERERGKLEVMRRYVEQKARGGINE